MLIHAHPVLISIRLLTSDKKDYVNLLLNEGQYPDFSAYFFNASLRRCQHFL